MILVGFLDYRIDFSPAELFAGSHAVMSRDNTVLLAGGSDDYRGEQTIFFNGSRKAFKRLVRVWLERLIFP